VRLLGRAMSKRELINEYLRWCVALATRSGPDYRYYPMGRETVLTPVTWEEGEFPRMSRINGEMNGWALPLANRAVDGTGFVCKRKS
jgi:hypothetical protein